MAKIGLTPAQCRAARSAIGISQKQLAQQADVSLPVVQEFERDGKRVPMEKNLRDIRIALEKGGAEFVVTADGRASVVFDDPDALMVQPADQ